MSELRLFRFCGYKEQSNENYIERRKGGGMDHMLIETGKFLAICDALGADGKDPDAAVRAALAAKKKLADHDSLINDLKRMGFGVLARLGLSHDDIIAWSIKRAEREHRK
jgi:hypothetical protein